MSNVRFPTGEDAGGEIHSIDCLWLSKIDRPPWIICSIRDCTVSTGAVVGVTTAVVGIMSWKSAVYVSVLAAVIGRSV